MTIQTDSFLRDAIKCPDLLKRGYCTLAVGCFLESFNVDFWKGQVLHL